MGACSYHEIGAHSAHSSAVGGAEKEMPERDRMTMSEVEQKLVRPVLPEMAGWAVIT